MTKEIRVPAMGESITEATIGNIFKKSDSFVKQDDEILELETDKVNQVLYAAQTGTIHWLIEQGDVVKIDQVIGSIEDSKADPEQKKEERKTLQETAPQEITLKAEGLSPKVSKPQQVEDKHLKEAKIVPFEETCDSSPKVVATSSKKETRRKLSNIRKLIGARLVDVMQQTAMLTTFNEVDMTNVMNLREQHKEAFFKKHQTKLGFMSFFVKAVVTALRAFPVIQAYIDGDDIVYRNNFSIGIAVSSDRGLVVPVIRDCDQLSFADIERSIENYAVKARSQGLKVSDLEGGGFTITNGGVFGSLLSTPILNPGQSAILGMHKILKRPVVIEDTIVIRQMMYLALSYDHRLIDGKEAVSFLVQVKKELEDPSCMLLDI